MLKKRPRPAYNSSQAGFTLIEMAIVVVIAGILISVIATVLPTLVRSAKIKKATAILEKVDYAIQGYIAANGRCPCPDTDAPTSPTYGQENRIPGTNPPSDDTCSAYVGQVPYVTLGIGAGADPWQNQIRYGVYQDMIHTTNTTFCGQAPCTLCLSNFVNNPNTAWLRTSDGTNNVNVAYVIASGGAQDMDSDNDFFDGLNAGAPGTLQFDIPDRVTSPTYDDLLVSGAFTYLQGRLCSGGGSGGGGGGNTENCSDVANQDEDGDGLVNCNDPDCFTNAACVGGTNVTIITPLLPSGVINQSYAATVQASGGQNPYQWTLTDNGGFTGLFLHTYTGQLSGQLNQCPGTYNATIRVDDATSPTSTNNSKSFPVTVTSDLSVSRTSGGIATIDWNSATQEETFQANGGHLGAVTWTATYGGANGFTVVPSGDSACIIKKNGETTTGTGPYTFVLTASDSACPANTAQLTLVVTVPASGTGAAAPYTVGMQAEWRLDECSVWDGSSYDVEDNLGNTLHFGRRIGNVTGVSQGRTCRAASLDGTSARIVSDVLTGSDIMAFTDLVTLACWFKSPGGGGSNPRLIEFANAAGSYTHSTAIAYDQDGSLRAWVSSESGVRGAQIDYSTETYADNLWHHVVYTYSAANGGKLYVDGSLKKTATDNLTSDIHDAETFVIGGYYPDGNNGFLGLIDEVIVLQNELTAAEVGQLYAADRSSCPGSCYTAPIAEYRMENAPWSGTADEVLDMGSGASNGVAAMAGSDVALPSQTDASSGKVCSAAVFSRINTADGSTLPSTSGAYLDMGDPTDGDLDPNTRPWTITSWINWDGSSGENIIYNKENLYEARVSGGYVNYAWQPHWYWDGGSSFPVSAHTWTHVTVSYDGSEQVLFKDGIQIYSRDQAGAVGGNGSKLLIGARGSGSPHNFFGGMLDEIKIYDRALSRSEILAIVNETRTCP